MLLLLLQSKIHVVLYQKKQAYSERYPLKRKCFNYFWVNSEALDRHSHVLFLTLISNQALVTRAEILIRIIFNQSICSPVN